jgi:hypothetical protein
MKYLVIGVLIALAYLGYSHFRGDDKPSAADVEPGLTSYLATGKGDCNVEHLSDISVGDFNSQFGGWPVYASHEETCRDGDTTTTISGLDHAETQIAAAFARRTASGQVELFLPSFFQNAQQQMQLSLDSAAPR